MKSRKYLITGATGNIGREVIHYLAELDPKSTITAAVRNVEKGNVIWENIIT